MVTAAAGQAWQAAGEDIDSIRMSWTRGYRPLGTRTQEWALSVGDNVSAVGELALASEGRTLDADRRHSAMGSGAHPVSWHKINSRWEWTSSHVKATLGSGTDSPLKVVRSVGLITLG